MKKSDNQLPAEALDMAAECLKVLGHPARLRIVEFLEAGPRAVNEIAQYCGLPAHQACGHLRLMQSHGFLTSQRHGRSVHYSIASPNLTGILGCIRKNCRPDDRANH